MRSAFRFVVAFAATSGALFFARYELRLLSVWPSMSKPRAGGAYVGLFAFPVLTATFLVVAYLAVRNKK